MEVIIREAELTDAEAIVRLSEQWGYPTALRDVVTQLKRLKESGTAKVFVAETGPVVIGWIFISERFGIGSPDFVEIRGLVVDNEFRRQGIGKKLMDAASEWSASMGFDKLRVKVNVTREAADEFYKNAGFEEEKIQVVYTRTLD